MDAGIRVGGGGFPAFERPAVLIIDSQRAFTVDVTGRGGTAAALENVAALVAAARAAGVPVYWFRTLFPEEADLGPVWEVKAPSLLSLRPGAEAAEFDPRTTPEPGETIIDKRRASAFFGTDAAAVLHENGHDGCYVAGFTTSGCIRATAVDAASHDLRPCVVSDAVSDREPEIHDMALRDLAARYADVRDLAQVRRELLPKS